MNHEPITPKAVILDMDGLMFDTETVFLKAFEQSAESFRVDGTSSAFLRCVGTTESDTKRILREEFGADLPVDEMFAKTKEIFNAIRRSGTLEKREGLMELLDFLDENNMPRTIASSSHTDTIRENLHMSDLEKYFPQYVGGNQVRNGKPDPEIYLKAASVLEIDPSACIVLEDSGPGIRAAHAAGMIPIMIPDIVQPSEEIRKLTHRIFPSLLEAKQYLEDCL